MLTHKSTRCTERRNDYLPVANVPLIYHLIIVLRLHSRINGYDISCSNASQLAVLVHQTGNVKLHSSRNDDVVHLGLTLILQHLLMVLLPQQLQILNPRHYTLWQPTHGLLFHLTVLDLCGTHPRLLQLDDPSDLLLGGVHLTLLLNVVLDQFLLDHVLEVLVVPIKPNPLYHKGTRIIQPVPIATRHKLLCSDIQPVIATH